MIEAIALGLILAGAWFWQDSMKSREQAVIEGNRACAAEGFQFLDWTVALKRVAIKRDDEGRLRFLRAYDFEYSDTGNNRMSGTVALLHRELVSIHLSSTQADKADIVSLH